MSTPAHEADRLNDLWDALAKSNDPVVETSASLLGLQMLLAADAETPPPSSEFLASLRQSLTAAPPLGRWTSRSQRSLGIVAYPFAPSRNGNHLSKQAILFAIAAILAIAILGTGFTLRAGGRPEIGLPTAQASALAATSTPVAFPTEIVRRTDR